MLSKDPEKNYIKNVFFQVIYLSIVVALGIGAVVVSTFDFFAGPKFRPLRAGETLGKMANLPKGRPVH
jgi:hypothetical protein